MTREQYQQFAAKVELLPKPILQECTRMMIVRLTPEGRKELFQWVFKEFSLREMGVEL